MSLSSIDFPSLSSIFFNFCSCSGVATLTLSQLPSLTSFIIVDGRETPYTSGSLLRVKDLVFAGNQIIRLLWHSRFTDVKYYSNWNPESCSCNNNDSFRWEFCRCFEIDLPSLSSFHISNNTLSAVTEMTARSRFPWEEWQIDLPILNEIEIVGNALNSLLYFNYTGITEGLYNQFCGNEIQCVELFCVFCKITLWGYECVVEKGQWKKENRNGHIWWKAP